MIETAPEIGRNHTPARRYPRRNRHHTPRVIFIAAILAIAWIVIFAMLGDHAAAAFAAGALSAIGLISASIS